MLAFLLHKASLNLCFLETLQLWILAMQQWDGSFFFFFSMSHWYLSYFTEIYCIEDFVDNGFFFSLLVTEKTGIKMSSKKYKE